ncbi:MAG: GGDEF domain-containing protein [Pirellulaceae bacterium]|nr:GGDEF domain-containing protein [Pirellulaceae bacterium]
MLYVGLTLVFLTGLAGGFLWGRQNNRFALQDPLTHLPNKPAFNQRLESLLENNGSSPKPLAILFLDIDHFKQINDCHGHLAGDEVLRQLGNLLATTGQPRNVFRWGGDEFTILSFGSRESVEQYAINIQQAIKQLAISQQSPPMLITVSIGVAQQTIDETGSQLLKRADQALYEAKRNGRNQVYWAASTTG